MLFSIKINDVFVSILFCEEEKHKRTHKNAARDSEKARKDMAVKDKSLFFVSKQHWKEKQINY